MTLEYEKEAAAQALDADCLVVFAKGIGIHSLLRRFIVLYADSPSIILLVCSKKKLPMLQECLAYEGN